MGRKGQGARRVQNRLPARGRGWWQRLVILAAVVYFAVTFTAQETQFATLRREIYQLQGEIGLRQAELNALRERRDYLQSADYVEAEARRRFNLTRPGEIHYLTIWDEPLADGDASADDDDPDGHGGLLP